MVQLTPISIYELRAGDQIAVKGLFRNLCEDLKDLYSLITGKDYYYHHGIFIGNERVVHYYGETKNDARPRIDHLRDFHRGIDRVLYRVDHDNTLDPDETVRAALSVVNNFESGDQNSRQRYNIFFNNCETLATWLKTGVRRSEQAEDAFSSFLKVTVPLVTASVASSATFNRLV